MAKDKRGYQAKKPRLSAVYAKRIAAARASVRATINFGHTEPSATELADRFGITLADARRILGQLLGDVIVERAPRGQTKRPEIFGAMAPGRGFGLGNLISLP